MSSDKGKGLARLVIDSGGSVDSNDPKLDKTAQTRIGDQLRAMYDDLVHQPVPDRFRELLDQLDRGEDPETAR